MSAQLPLASVAERVSGLADARRRMSALAQYLETTPEEATRVFEASRCRTVEQFIAGAEARHDMQGGED